MLMLKFLKDKRQKKEYMDGATTSFIFFKTIYDICRNTPNGSEIESIILNSWWKKHSRPINTPYFKGCVDTFNLFILQERTACGYVMHVKPEIRTISTEVFNATIR